MKKFVYPTDLSTSDVVEDSPDGLVNEVWAREQSGRSQLQVLVLVNVNSFHQLQMCPLCVVDLDFVD